MTHSDGGAELMNNESMPCEWCDSDEDEPPALLNIHGMIASKGEPTCWGHSYEDSWWPCQRKAAEEHALIVELLGLFKTIVADAERAANPSARQYKYKQIQAAIAKANELCNEPTKGE